MSETDAAETRYRTCSVEGNAQGDQILLRTSHDSDWHVLGGPARRIWEMLEYPATRPALVASLISEFEATEEVIAQAVDRVLDELIGLGLARSVTQGSVDPVRDLYLGLLKRSVANLLYPELELAIAFLEEGAEGLSGQELQRALRDVGLRRLGDYERLLAAKQRGAPLRHAHTMIGKFRLDNIERLAERLFEDGIEGDFLEAGVCRGGAAIFMRGVQVAHGEGSRRVWAVDSFQGVPPSTREEDRAYGVKLEEERQPWLACDLAGVRDNFRRYGLLDPEVRFVAGWLEDTLPAAPIGDLALLRLDVDLYSATYHALDLLYDKLVPGGFVIADEYGVFRPCRDAVDAFRERRGIADPIEWIDPSGIYWRKPR